VKSVLGELSCLKASQFLICGEVIAEASDQKRGKEMGGKMTEKAINPYWGVPSSSVIV